MASQDDSQAIEVIGADPDLLDDTTGKKDIEFTITRTADNGTEYDLLVNDNILYLDEKNIIIKSISSQILKLTRKGRFRKSNSKPRLRCDTKQSLCGRYDQWDVYRQEDA